jgi:hypothetical protein
MEQRYVSKMEARKEETGHQVIAVNQYTAETIYIYKQILETRTRYH